jgi:predicted ribosome quality control (RQC) complex YloA/Tae2 family protein
MKTFKVFDNLVNEELDIIMGKSAEENWKIIDDSNENDIWFHLDDFPSAHVILKTKDRDMKELNKQTLIHCASICKENSKYSNMKNISVIYTKIKNVKKADSVGSVTTSSTKILKI